MMGIIHAMGGGITQRTLRAQRALRRKEEPKSTDPDPRPIRKIGVWGTRRREEKKNPRAQAGVPVPQDGSNPRAQAGVPVPQEGSNPRAQPGMAVPQEGRFSGAVGWDKMAGEGLKR